MVEATSVLPAAEREERERQEAEAIRQRIGSSSSGSTEYIAEKKNGDIQNAEYQKTVVEQTPDGYVKRERDTYVTQFTSRGFRNAVYDRRVEYYNREGELVRVETFGKHKRGSGRGSMRVYKTGETRYADGEKTYEYSMSRRFKDGDKIKESERNYETGARREKDYREPPKKVRRDTVYEFESGGKTYRTGSAAFVEQKTGIDPRKLDNETIVLRDTKTGKSDVFRIEGRDEKNPKQAGLAVRVQEPTNRPPVIVSLGPDESPGERTQSLLPDPPSDTPNTPPTPAAPGFTPPEGEYGGNITFQPEVPDIIPRGGPRFKDGVYQGVLTEAPESYKNPGVEDRVFRIREQADFEGDVGTGAVAFVGGVVIAGGSLIVRGFTRPFETAKDVAVGTVTAILNPADAVASIKARPEKFLGENIVLAGIAKGVAKARAGDVAAAVKPYEGKVVTPETAVALRESGASSVEVRPVVGEQQAGVAVDAGGVRVEAGVRRPVEAKGETVPVEELNPPEYYSFAGEQRIKTSVRPDLPPGESSPASGEPGVLVKDALVESTGEVGPAASNVDLTRRFTGEVKASEVGERVVRYEVSEGSAPLGVRGERVGTSDITFQPFEVRGGVPGYPKTDAKPPGPSARKLDSQPVIEFRPALEFFEEQLYAEAGGEAVVVSKGSGGTVSVERTPVRVTGATPSAPGGASGFSYFVESPGPGGTVTIQEQRVEVGQPSPEPPRTATTDLAASSERGVEPPQYEVSSPQGERDVGSGPRSPREGESFRDFYDAAREARDLNRENFRSFQGARPVISSDSRSGTGSDLGEQQRYEQEQFQQQEVDVTLEQGQASGVDFSQESATDQSSQQRQESRQQQGLLFGQLGASGSGSAPPRGPRAPTEKPPKKIPPIRLRDSDRDRDDRPSRATAFVRRGGVFRPIAVGTVAEVTEKASKVVRSTAAASFRVVERGKPVGFDRLKSFIPSSIYRPAKGDPFTAVQKRATRISSPGERLEIRPKRTKRRLF